MPAVPGAGQARQVVPKATLHRESGRDGGAQDQAQPQSGACDHPAQESVGQGQAPQVSRSQAQGVGGPDVKSTPSIRPTPVGGITSAPLSRQALAPQRP